MRSRTLYRTDVDDPGIDSDDDVVSVQFVRPAFPDVAEPDHRPGAPRSAADGGQASLRTLERFALLAGVDDVDSDPCWRLF